MSLVQEKVLIAVSMKHNMDEIIKQKCFALLGRLTSAASHEGYHVATIVDTGGTGDKAISNHVDRARHCAEVRHTFKVNHYKGFAPDWFMWMDADIIGTHDDLVCRLIDISRKHKAVVAPSIVLEGTNHRQWYDTAGFVHKDKRFSPFPPYHTEIAMEVEKGIWELDGSVGCVYLIPGEVLKESCYFPPQNPLFTEHYPVCQRARQIGYKLLWDSSSIAIHAYLPHYGERFH